MDTMNSTLRLSLLVLLLAACPAPLSDAERYHQALVEAPDYAAASAHCAQITEAGLAGDCLVASMERFDHLVPEDCAGIEEGLWRDECFFLLAERQWRSGLQAEALDTCRQTRFSRACTWHLVQDEAEAGAVEEPAVAEQRLRPFVENRIAPDAALHFWKLWLRARLGDGHPIDETECADLQDVRSCRQAVGRTLHELLEASGRKDRLAVCAAPAGERVIMNGAPAWAAGPLTESAEQQWISRHCPSTPDPER